MQTLSKGIKKPQTGDRGSVFYPALADNAQKQNDHTHNGTDGEPVNAKYITKTTASILAAGWVAVAGQAGTYRQLVTLPTGFTEVNTAEIGFVDAAGEKLMLDIERVSATTYFVYINDNAQTVTATYG